MVIAPYLDDGDLQIFCGDSLSVLRELPSGSATAVVTSPPYLDKRPEYDSPTESEFREIFSELGRVLTGGMLINVGRIWRDGEEVLWWEKLIVQARLAGWLHLDTIVWIRPNANPIQGRVLTDSHEYVLVFGRKDTQFNSDSWRTEYSEESLARMERRWTGRSSGIKGRDDGNQNGREPNQKGARGRSFVIRYTGAEKGNPHPAPMPVRLAEDLINLGSWTGATILDPFAGSGTTGIAARLLRRKSILIEKDETYCALTAERTQQLSLMSE